MKPDYEYTTNLLDFIEHAEEDEVDSINFLKELKNFKLSRKIDWLDVGAGPGTKLVMILEGDKNNEGLLQSKNINLDITEPSIDWRKMLLENFGGANLEKHLKNVYLYEWEDFIEQKEITYDLITFFHSAYGIEKKSLLKIPAYLKKGGVGLIVVENKNSDLYKLKSNLLPFLKQYGIKTDLKTSSQQITDVLDFGGVKYHSFSKEINQRFYVDDLLDKNNPERVKCLSFLIQTNTHNYNQLLSKEMKTVLEESIDALAKKDKQGRHYLNIPDKFIWIKHSDKK